MRAHGGFIDLRVGRSGASGGIGDDSVWPSFTDIMTVVVMIFLMALVIMMVRNFDLDRRLLSSVSAQQASSQENRALTDQIAALRAEEARLTDQLADLNARFSELQLRTGGEISRLRASGESLTEQLAAVTAQFDQARALLETEQQRRLQLADEEARLIVQLADLNARLDEMELRTSSEIASLSGANASLTEQLAAATAQFQQVTALLQAEQQRRRELDAELEAQRGELQAKQESLAQLQALQQQATERYAGASAEIARLNESIGNSEAEIARLNDSIRQRQAENAALKRLADAAGDRFRSLQQEYDSLDAEYRALARPARSPAGKHVVEVRILEVDDGVRFRLIEPDGAAATYAKDELMAQLERLKQAHGRGLYTKVVIPEDSAMTHNRAWQLTQEILRGYDYYYQDQADPDG